MLGRVAVLLFRSVLNETPSSLSQDLLDFLVELFGSERTVLIKRFTCWNDIFPDEHNELGMAILHAFQLHNDELLERLIVELEFLDLLHQFEVSFR